MGSTSATMRVRQRVAIQILNRAGNLLEKAGLPRFRADEGILVDAARRQAGLDDFGDDSFREPLRRLVDSLVKDARLNTLGKIAARQEILQLLVNRL
ncbi:MAG TPA: hypothetical protein VG733_05670, partial [Chthoniobacteraceae bacterium]|nr:hypothetical protein [Chthoniobacteraceae bacterium]